MDQEFRARRPATDRFLKDGAPIPSLRGRRFRTVDAESRNLRNQYLSMHHFSLYVVFPVLCTLAKTQNSEGRIAPPVPAGTAKPYYGCGFIGNMRIHNFI